MAIPQQKQKKAINWKAIHKRFDNTNEAIERGVAKTQQEKKKILKARAKLLSRESESPEMSSECIEIVEFLLANENYGIESTYVREVYQLNDLTPIPCTPSFVLGVINVHGQILSVIDIKKFFNLPEKGLGDLNKVIILHSDSIEFGILADAILDVHSIPLKEIQPSLPTLTGIRKEYLLGVTEKRVVILDGQKLLTDKNIIVREGETE